MVTPILDIVCLCADWCGTCREYEATFEQLQGLLPGHRYRWIDIEDESDLVGEVDVETFPTLLVACQGQVLFAGPVLPRLPDAQRIVDAMLGQLTPEGGVPARDAHALGLPVDQFQAFSALARGLG